MSSTQPQDRLVYRPSVITIGGVISTLVAFLVTLYGMVGLAFNDTGSSMQIFVAIVLIVVGMVIGWGGIYLLSSSRFLRTKEPMSSEVAATIRRRTVLLGFALILTSAIVGIYGFYLFAQKGTDALSSILMFAAIVGFFYGISLARRK